MSVNHSSFRDPAGFIFEHEGTIYRAITQEGQKDYDLLMSSGLAQQLIGKQLLVPHENVHLPGLYNDTYTIIKPSRVNLISYPYEWSFSQLKEAALVTLDVLNAALHHGMILKDASAFNIQFNGCDAIFIDTLSFTQYEDGQAWQGYRQFCEHFLAPLCLASQKGAGFQSFNKLGLERVGLKMTSSLLPFRTWFSTVPLLHIHLHARAVSNYGVGKKSGATTPRKIAKKDLLAMVDHLRQYIYGLTLPGSKSQWGDYDQETHYSGESKDNKKQLVVAMANSVNPGVVWDMGANDGHFSRAMAAGNRHVLSLDFDPIAVEKNFLRCRKGGFKNVNTLLFDITNPTPSMGWANKERPMLSERSKPDLITALALIHHLTITFNVSFEKVAAYFASLAHHLVIEFVPPDDPKVGELPDNAGKKTYNYENFRKGFLVHFNLVREEKISGSERILLLFRGKAL